MDERKKIFTPLSEETVLSLKSGDRVLINGKVFTARDAAHKRLVGLLKEGKELPFDVKGQIIYYVGPAPAKPGYPIGPAGPTTSIRMDPYTPPLLDAGLKGMIGKGPRGKEVVDSMIKNKAVYFVVVGGAAALVAKSIKNVKIIAYEDLGPEAIRELEVEDLPAIVAIDCMGKNLFVEGPQKYKEVI